jgi:hypothetical protein
MTPVPKTVAIKTGMLRRKALFICSLLELREYRNRRYAEFVQ